jgi:hypothetical protein
LCPFSSGRGPRAIPALLGVPTASAKATVRPDGCCDQCQGCCQGVRGRCGSVRGDRPDRVLFPGERDVEYRQQDRGLPAEQDQGVEVGVTAAQAPMQAVDRAAVGRTRLEGGDALPLGYPVTDGDGRADRFVGGAQRRVAGAGQFDGEHSAVRDRPREGDPARPHCSNRPPRFPGEVHSPVARRPGGGRWLVGPFHLGIRYGPDEQQGRVQL